MLVISFAVLTLVCSASAAPRDKRFDAYDGDFTPFNPFAFTYTRPFGGFAGAGSGFGFPWFPQFQPYPAMYIPMPDFSKFIPWYKGNNVCETKKVMEEPDEIKEWLSDGLEGSFDYSHESQNCRGNNERYACIKRITTNEGNKMEMTKYQCCYGFVRPTNGDPGCIESSKQQNSDTSASATSSSQIKMKDQFKYNFYKDNLKEKSGVESVPSQ